jgi:hypothetical protein
MPNLILFAACENLIISRENKVSLISLLENINIGLPPNQVIPPNASLPFNWFALTVWEKIPSDANKEFETQVEAGPLKSNIARFRIPTPLHRVAAQIVGFPIQLGQMRLKAYLREVGSSDWAVVGQYPLNVQRTITPVPGGPVH